MTYYRVEFCKADQAAGTSKNFRTKDQAEAYAKRVLRVDDQQELESRVNILAVNAQRN